MLRSAISVWSILILSILASATASAQSFDFGSLNPANSQTGGNSNSSTSASSSSSRTSTGASANSNAGVNEFSINTDNVQNAATGFVGGNASQAFVGGAREATNHRPELSGVNVELTADGVALLTGTSPNAEASRLAANLVRLQPGVRKVNNQIAVAQ
jgi:hypothetical protein